MRKKRTNKNTWHSEKRGFTLIEVIVVLTIMGIMASIVAPNFSGYIHKLQVKEIVRQAKLMDDELSALTARQYAEIGLAPRIGHNGSDAYGTPGLQTVPKNNYIEAVVVNGNGGLSYFGITATGGGAPQRGTGYVTLANNIVPANAAAINPSRVSAGLTEFYRQTGIDLATMERGPGTATVNSNFDTERRWYALQFYPIDYLGRKDPATGNFLYIHPEESIGGLFYVKYEGTWFMVIHNGKMKGRSTWLNVNQMDADPGHWNVYRDTGRITGGWAEYENTDGKPFGVISD
jgi:prepilin-type N-terminal cleavage/methylation domain-containing protein